MRSTAHIKNNTSANSGSALRYGMFIPLAFMIASVITCCFSYSNAKQDIANDLNNAMIALAHENSDLWTRPDTIAAIRHLHETTHISALLTHTHLISRYIPPTICNYLCTL